VGKSHDDGDATVLGEADLGAPLLLTKQQAALWAQVSEFKIKEWLSEPDFPAIRTPRHVRIHARLFEAWLENKAGAPHV